MPPKRTSRQAATKPKSKAAAKRSTTVKRTLRVSTKAAAKRTSKEGVSSSSSTSRRTSGARGRTAAAEKAAGKGKPSLVSSRASARKPRPTSTTSRSASFSLRRGSTVKATNKARAESEEDAEEDSSEAVDDKRKESGSDEDHISSSVMQTPLEVSDDDVEDDDGASSEDALLLHSTSDIAVDANAGEEQRRHETLGRGPAHVLAAPSLHQQEERHEEAEDEKKGSPDRDDSPEALTADSDSKRSSLRWQQQLMANATSVTQPLREAEEEGEGGDATVKRLFARPPRSIAYSASLSSPSSSSSSSSFSLAFLDDAADRTLPMENEEGDGTQLEIDSRAHAPTLSANRVAQSGQLSTVAGRSPSSRRGSSLIHAPPPPGSPTADTPPPPVALLMQQERDAVPSSVRIEPKEVEADHGEEEKSQGLHSGQTSLLTESTRLFTAQSWSSSMALLPDHDTDSAEEGESVRANDSGGVRCVGEEQWPEGSASPHPRSEATTIFMSTAPRPVEPAETTSHASAELVYFTAPHGPSTSGHLRMSGGSISRARSPSATSASSRLSFGWLKKVNAGVEVPSAAATGSEATTTTTTATRPTHLSALPAASGVFPAYPLPLQSSSGPSQGVHRHSPYVSASPPIVPPPAIDDHRSSSGVGGRSGSNSVSHSGNSSPLRLRQREPPAWRSPQPAHLPVSLTVSPSSVQPAAVYRPPNNNIYFNNPSNNNNSHNGGAIQVNDDDEATMSLHGTSPPAPRGTRERSLSDSSASTSVLTQTFTQASSTGTSVPATEGQLTTPVHQSASWSSPSFGTAASPGQGAAATSRPSTQLITKAAATRPTASPATMWICLDDDDEDDDDDAGEGDDEELEKKDVLDSKPAHKDAMSVDESASKRINRLVVSEHAGPVRSRQHSPQMRGRDESVENDTEAHAAHRHQQQQLRKTSPSRRRPPEKSYPIAEILSPTFRPRRRPTQQSSSQGFNEAEDSNDDDEATTATAAPVAATTAASPPTLHPPHAFGNDPHRPFIFLDDDSDPEEKELSNEGPPFKQARLSVSPTRLAIASPDSTHNASQSSLPLIIDDDDDDEEQNALEVKANAAAKMQESAAHAEPRQSNRRSGQRLSIQLPSASDDSQVNSPLKPTVKDLFFPKRLDPEVRPSSPLYESIHAYQQQFQQQQQQQEEEEEEEGNTNDGRSRTVVHSAAEVATRTGGREARPSLQHVQQLSKKDKAGAQKREVLPHVAGVQESPGHKRSRGAQSRTSTASLKPALPDSGRLADTLLRDFFPTKFTKKSFMDAAQTVMSPLHFLEPGDFWQAFTSAEFVGEGSFGLVWRCRTVDGDLVAVKSCPIILRTKANIEDSFSTIREIATMRFLNEMQVPYILPLHSAFFVKAAEALPPVAQEALEWRQQLRKRAEAVVLEKEVRLLGKGRASLSKRGGGAGRVRCRPMKDGRTSAAAVANDVPADLPLTFNERVDVELAKHAAAETRGEKLLRARMQAVRLPRFLSITEDDLRQSEATAFLVMELCDGDVEGIPRSDGVAKGVVYCVSSALAAMHELGILHLDLKPSNVLFAYEHGPSQVSPSSSPPVAGRGGVVAAAASTAPMDAVKFYLSDFGNCRLVGPKPLDEVPDAYGTFEYMDLPALQDAVCGRPTDAFSLGATLFELLYGKRLYPKCLNPKCAEDEDHSRACFVEAARRPVVLPRLPLANPPARTAGPPPSGITVLSSTGPNGNTKPAVGAATALTPLQTLTAALLQRKWSARMTTAECRRFLIDAFHITQAEAVDDGGEHEEE